MVEPGVLYIVATPIGNLSDMVPRAVSILQAVDLIAAEDTRHSASLLQHFGITTPAIAYHDHNEASKATWLLSKLETGQSIALISDAGTPLISDPGYRLVSEVRRAGLQVVPVPGACALIAALSASGLPSDRFLFCGFPPAKSSQRVKLFESLSQDIATLVFYESSHRILASLGDMIGVFGDTREAVIARELTKRYETFLSGSLVELSQKVAEDANQRRGEFVVMVGGAKPQKLDDLNLKPEALKLMSLLLAEGLSKKQCASIAASYTGEKKKRLYDWAIAQPR